MGISGKRRVATLLSWQAEVVSRRQALCAGMTAGELRHRIRDGGAWRPVLPGVYVAATGQPTVDQLDMAALLYAGAGSMITGLAAVRRHALRVPSTPIVDVLVPNNVQRSSVSYVRLHRTRQIPELVFSDGEIKFVSLPRAVIDAARWMSDLREVRALICGAVQQGRCSLDHLAAELAEPRLPGSALARRVLAEVSLGIRSPAEGDLMDLIKRSVLPEPLYNPRLFLRNVLLAVPDAWWPQACVAVEVDSREWHLSADSWDWTMERHRQMTAAGISVLHFSPSQIRRAGGKVIAQIGDALQHGRPAPAAITTVPAAGLK